MPPGMKVKTASGLSEEIFESSGWKSSVPDLEWFDGEGKDDEETPQ